MLFNFLVPLADDFGPFNLFRYLTFRTGGAVLTALVVSFICGPAVIRWLRAKQGNGQPIRDDGPQSHIIDKAGTPTMGGFLILLALTISTLLWADITSWGTRHFTAWRGNRGTMMPSDTAERRDVRTIRTETLGSQASPVQWTE